MRCVHVSGSLWASALLVFWFLNSPVDAYELENLAPRNVPPVLNLVFCAVNYPSGLPVIERDVELLSAVLGRVQPFSDFSANIGLFRVDFVTGEERDIFRRQDVSPFLILKKDFLENVYYRLGRNFKLVVLDGAGGESLSELSALSNTSVIIISRAKHRDDQVFTCVFLHELGHALGLRDEALDSSAVRCPPGPPNCARTQAEARLWWGGMSEASGRVGFFNGCCGNMNFFRPTIASFMNAPDKAGDYGPVNELYLRQALESSLISLLKNRQALLQYPEL